MIPVNLADVIHDALKESRRKPDGLLHASSDLMGSLRHAQLAIAGAPKVESEITSDVRLMTGTMWHNFVHEALVKKGVPFMQEVKLAPYLPEGWSGTADWVFWSDEYKAFVLGDLKTIKGEGLRWIEKGGAKDEHLWQLSAYWYALEKMGIPLVKGFGILYLPMNDTTDKDELIEPTVMECDPIPWDALNDRMSSRWELTHRYITSLGDSSEERWAEIAPLQTPDNPRPYPFWITEALAPEMEREQKLDWNGKQNVWDLKLTPHWSTAYCPYPSELCACSEQSINKIGHYTLAGEYAPREGYETIAPLTFPAASEVEKRREAQNA